MVRRRHHGIATLRQDIDASVERYLTRGARACYFDSVRCSKYDVLTSASQRAPSTGEAGLAERGEAIVTAVLWIDIEHYELVGTEAKVSLAIPHQLLITLISVVGERPCGYGCLAGA
jgi:hypothetical protein